MDTSPVPGLALVTGAATGVGAELARCLVDDGYAVVLADDDPRVLDTARVLAAEGGCAVALRVDLSTAAGVRAVHRLVLDQPEVLEVVVLDLGTATQGRQHEVPVAEDLRVVDADVRSTVHLVKLVLPDLVHRARGRLLLWSPLPAQAEGPQPATYAAAQAFARTYADTVRREVRASGLTVTWAQPGSDDPSDPAATAREAYDALCAGVPDVVTGARTLLRAAVEMVVPDRLRPPTPAGPRQRRTG